MRLTPHPLTLRQLQYVVAVADAGSFRRAADLCHVSQPSLSSQLAQVESVLGVTLFERARRPVILTPAGAEVVRRARSVLLGADDLVDSASRYVDPLAGVLRVGVIPTVAPYLVPEVAPALRREIPRLRVLWSEERTEGLVAALAGGALDAGILALEADLGPVDHEVIARDAFVVAVGRSHPLARSRKPLRAATLDPADLLLLSDGHCLREQALAACGRSAQDGAPFAATSLATLAQVVAGGTGVTLLPEMALPLENRNGDLHLRRFTEPQPGRTIVLAWRKGSPLGAGMRRVAEVLRAAYPRPA